MFLVGTTRRWHCGRRADRNRLKILIFLLILFGFPCGLRFDPASVRMDEDGGLGNRNWGYYEPPLKGNLVLQLMSSVAERDTKPMQSNGGLFHRDCGVPELSVPMDFVRDGLFHHGRDGNKMLHVLPVNHHHYQQQQHSHYGILPDPPVSQSIQMFQHTEVPKDDEFPIIDGPVCKIETPLKKRPQGRPQKSPKPKKPKKASAPKDETTNNSVSRGRASRKSAGMVINGINLDISGIATPFCSCTGKPQQCYRWGAGGWQSACCTTSISMYPLPMSTKRQGVRIAGRKMSQGAFRKVLENLTQKGHNLSNPIDLRPFWAKHGTNKFVTIR